MSRGGESVDSTEGITDDVADADGTTAVPASLVAAVAGVASISVWAVGKLLTDVSAQLVDSVAAVVAGGGELELLPSGCLASTAGVRSIVGSPCASISPLVSPTAALVGPGMSDGGRRPVAVGASVRLLVAVVVAVAVVFAVVFAVAGAGMPWAFCASVVADASIVGRKTLGSGAGRVIGDIARRSCKVCGNMQDTESSARIVRDEMG